MAAANQDEAIAQLTQAIDFLKADKTGDATAKAALAALTTQRDQLVASNALTTTQRDAAYAVLKSKGFNPDGSPITVTPPPPVIVDSLALTPGMDSQGFNQVLCVVNWGNGKPPKLVKWEHLDPDVGGGAWSTDPMDGAIDRFVFTWLPNGPQRIKVSSLDAGDTRTVTKSVTLSGITNTPPPVVVPPVTGLKKWGCYNTYGPSGWASFNSKVGKTSTQHMSYLDTHDMSGLEDIISFLKAFPNVHYKLSLNVLIGERGNFNSTGERDRCRAIFKRLHEAGVANRVQIRHMYEKNAQYGFEWHSTDYAGINKLFDDIVLIGRAEAPEMEGYIECMVPWDANQAEMERVHSKLPNIIIGLDNYNSWGQNGYKQRGLTGISWAKSKGAKWSWDEYANRTTDNNGYGDEVAFITWTKQQTLDPSCDSDTVFDSPDGGVGMTLSGNSLTEFKKQLVLVGEA